MKKLLFILTLISQQLFSQTTAVINGGVSTDIDTVTVINFPNYFNSLSTSTIQLTDKGKFEVSRESLNPEFLQLVIEKDSFLLYLEPNHQLEIEIIEEIKFNGSGDNISNNQFLQAFQKKFPDAFHPEMLNSQMESKHIDEFEMVLYDRRKAQLDFLNKWNGTTKLTTDFYNLMQKSIELNYHGLLLAHPIINANKSTSILRVNPLPSIIEKEIPHNLITAPAMLISPMLQHFLNYYIIYFTSRSNNYNKFPDGNVSLERKFTFAYEKFTEPIVKVWLSDFLYNNCQTLTATTFDHYFKKLQHYAPEKEISEKIKNKCNSIVQVTTSEKESKEIKKKSSNGGMFTDWDGKEASLEDFKGKVVYIDVWASWCGPCRQQFPHAKKLQDQLTSKQKKDIVFLYINIDDTEQAWKKAVKQIGIEGTHLYSPGGWNSHVVKLFGIEGIPRYILLDKNGKVLYKNAKRPSDVGILEDILQLID